MREERLTWRATVDTPLPKCDCEPPCHPIAEYPALVLIRLKLFIPRATFPQHCLDLSARSPLLRSLI